MLYPRVSQHSYTERSLMLYRVSQDMHSYTDRSLMLYRVSQDMHSGQSEKITYAVPCITAQLYRKITSAVPCIRGYAQPYRKITYAVPCITGYVCTVRLKRSFINAVPYITGYAQPDRKDPVCCTVYHIGYAQPLLIQKKGKKKKRKEKKRRSLMHVTTSCSHVHVSGLAVGHGNAKLVTLRGLD